MAFATDFLRLSEQELFKQISKVVCNLSPKTRNILECKDNILYVWNTDENCLLTLNLKTWPENDSNVIFQTLLPSDPATFSVERISCNKSATQLLAFGLNGITVVDLPRRWGKFSLFHGSKPVVQCKSHILDKRYFSCNPNVVIKQARWHPGLSTDSYLFLLTSENSFRIYETSGTDPILLNVYALGRRPASTRVPILAGLGDTSVDFDFAPPIPIENISLYTTQNKYSVFDSVTWPVLVLHGNGDVYTVIFSLLNKTQKPLVQGPLPMVPPDEDNYGVDACSILCLHTTPPTIIISTCIGTLYHCLLLDSEEDDSEENQQSLSAWSSVNYKFGISRSAATLHVLECIELELGLALNASEDIYTCPVLLRRDPTMFGRYFCFHDTGLHIISVPFTAALDEFSHAKCDELDLKAPSFKEVSTAHYAICTRTSGSSELAPIQGLAIATSPTVVITLLATGEVTSLALTSLNVSSMPSFIDSEKKSDGIVIHRESFEDHVKRLLHHEMSQPLIKLSQDSNPCPRECMDLLSRATGVLRDEYILRLARVKEEIERKVRTLRKLREYQLQEVEMIQKEREKLKRFAEHLAEKYEDTKDKQEMLARVAERTLRLSIIKQPATTLSEKKFIRSLNEAKNKIRDYEEAVSCIREKQLHHKKDVETWVREQNRSVVHLSETQQRVIKNNLLQMSRSIRDVTRCLQNILKVMEKDVSLLEHGMEKLDIGI